MVAARARVKVVPVTIEGSGDLMPSRNEYLMTYGDIRVRG